VGQLQKWLKYAQTFVDLPFSLFSHENMPLVSLWHFFHKGDKQNTVHFTTYCNGCMEHHHRELLLSEQRDDLEMNDASRLERKTRIFNDGAQLKIAHNYLLITQHACQPPNCKE
jgi:hypothetical protein